MFSQHTPQKKIKTHKRFIEFINAINNAQLKCIGGAKKVKKKKAVMVMDALLFSLFNTTVTNWSNVFNPWEV